MRRDPTCKFLKQNVNFSIWKKIEEMAIAAPDPGPTITSIVMASANP